MSNALIKLLRKNFLGALVGKAFQFNTNGILSGSLSSSSIGLFKIAFYILDFVKQRASSIVREKTRTSSHWC